VWVGLLAPAKTPADMVAALGDEIRRISDLPAVREKLAVAGADPMVMPPPEFDKLIRTDFAVLDRLMRNAN
jgi:tripartite-type tricarboxylate transporter receptor subunit TctC